MTPAKALYARPLACAAIIGLTLSLGCAAAAGPGQDGAAQNAAGQNAGTDPRKLTTIHTAAVDVGPTKNAVEVRYLNLPWGEKTFGYLEVGGDDYYSTRSWPVAHLKLARAATYDGKTLEPGDYVIILSPRNEAKKTEMTLSIASFKPDAATGTFLVPGNVFADAPADAAVVSTKPVKFAKGGPVAPAFEVTVDKAADGVAINLHYGDRTLTEKLAIK